VGPVSEKVAAASFRAQQVEDRDRGFLLRLGKNQQRCRDDHNSSEEHNVDLNMDALK
jgi:hypothetical protein